MLAFPGLIALVFLQDPFAPNAASPLQPAPEAPTIDDLPELAVDHPVEGEITADSPVVHTTTLDKNYADAPVRGITYRLEVPAGPVTIELRSFFFDAYLVVRDRIGEVVAEDDDSGLQTHARVILRGRPKDEQLRVEACALHGARGAFTLAARAGLPEQLDARTEAEALLADARQAMDAIRARFGEESLEFASSCIGCANHLRNSGRGSEARPLYERALAIREELLGPEHAHTATSLNDLAMLLEDEGDQVAARLLYERALATYEKTLGSDHPYTATTLSNLSEMLRKQGKFAEAQPLCERSLAIRERSLGPEHADTVTSLSSLAAMLRNQGKLAEAGPLYERAVKIREKMSGPEHPDTATCLNNLALLLKDQGNYVAARPLYERALAIYEKTLGPEHRRTVTTLGNLAELVRAGGTLAEARPLCERALALREQVLGPEHPDTAKSLIDLARLLDDHGDYSAARPLFERALAICEKTLGPKHSNTATTLNDFAELLRHQGKFAEARLLCERALTIREKVLGPEHADTATSLNNLSTLLGELGGYAEARPLCERALAIREKVLGPEHPATTRCLNNLALLLENMSELAEARVLFERALAIRVKVLGPDHTDTATSLNNLAALLHHQGKSVEARPLYERALVIRERALGAEHPDVANILSNLAVLHSGEDNFPEARTLHERALKIREKVLGPDHPDTARSLNNLATVLVDHGNSAEARPMFESALAVFEKTLGPEHPNTARSLNSVALLLKSTGHYEEARPLYERALAIREKTRGPDHPDTANSLNNLAALRQAQGNFAAARLLCERALAISEKTLGPDHPYTATTLSNLAEMLREQRKLAEARSLCERALAIREKVLGPEHSDTATSLGLLALLCFDVGEVDGAFALASRSERATQARALASCASCAEWERFQITAGAFSSVERLLDIASASGEAAKATAAYDAVLCWKGRVNHGLCESRQRLLASMEPTARSTLEELRAIQSRLSFEVARWDTADEAADEEELRKLREMRSQCERTLGREMAAAQPGDDATAAEIAALLPPRTALIDLLLHRPDRAVPPRDGLARTQRARRTENVTAWILHSSATVPTRIELGATDVLRQTVVDYLNALTSVGGSPAAAAVNDGPFEAASKRLRELLWSPIASNVADAEILFISPDGFLGTLPFETIPVEDGKFLVEQKTCVYVESGSALARTLRRPPTVRDRTSGAALVAGGIDYDARTEAAAPITNSPNAALIAAADHNLRGGLKKSWEPLAFSATEARTVAERRGASVQLLEGGAATEEALKRSLAAKRYVHLATHGFFQPEGIPSMWENALARRDELGLARIGEMQRITGLMPGLLTGLVCAGANLALVERHDNGLLTAEEITWLDLSACDLVVLSACETGLGEDRGGQGMMSLRSAFELAGAKTVIASLWNVNDKTTSELMDGFYRRLWVEGRSISESLRGAQLDMIRRGLPPSAWGCFTLSGDWR